MAKYEADDRGNVVQFYDLETDEIVGELDREACIDGAVDQLAWWGSEAVKQWAMENGYADEIKAAFSLDQ